MKRLNKIFSFLALFILPVTSLTAQEKFAGKVEFDRTVVDFGDISLEDGPQSCSYTVTNISDKPMVIYTVANSCGCTDVKWTREPILPGKKGQISAVYSNDEGPYPFDKTLTVHFSDMSKPVVLRFRGVSHQKKLPLNEIYTVRRGAMGLKEDAIKCGNIEQGGMRSDMFYVANLSDRPMTVSFKDLSPQLIIKAEPSTVAAGQTAKISYTVKADRALWGKNWYSATPVVNGKAQDPIRIWAFTKENFSAYTKAMKDAAPVVSFKTCAYSFNRVRKGTKVNASYEFTVSGKENFVVHKIDCDFPGVKVNPIPEIKPGQKYRITAEVDTSELPSGETNVIITLVTNSPSRPLVNLFVHGWLD